MSEMSKVLTQSG